MYTTDKIPTPLANHVIFKNPFNLSEDKMEEINKLPKAQQQDYMMKNYGDVWEKIEVVAVGEAVTNVRAGDKVIMSSTQAVASGIGIMKGKYTLVRESVILAKW